MVICSVMDVNTEFSGPALLALVSSVITAIAAFLPWMTAEPVAGPADVEAATMGIETLGLLTVLIAVVAILIVLLVEFESRETLSVSVIGAIVSFVSLWKITEISGAVSPGFGLYLTVFGGIGLLVAGLWGYQDTRREPSAGAAS